MRLENQIANVWMQYSQKSKRFRPLLKNIKNNRLFQALVASAATLVLMISLLVFLINISGALIAFLIMGLIISQVFGFTGIQWI